MSSERDTDSCALCGGSGHTRSNCPWGGKLANGHVRSLPALTADRLREVLRYDPETGVFTWLVCMSNARSGAVAGGVRADGYWRIGVDKIVYLAHRLAWLYVNGEWPSNQIDHIDGSRSNNRINNLRDVSNDVNQQNRRWARSDNISSGLIGVGMKRGKWRARIQVGGVLRQIGTFDTPEEAHAAYLDAKRRLHVGCTI